VTATAARTTGPDGGHWYQKDGTPAYEVPYADPRKGMRKTTLADARKLGLLPSTTTILRVLNRPQLNSWYNEQCCLAVLTSPRLPGEPLDTFVDRVLNVECVQDQEADAAKDRGIGLHDGLESKLLGRDVDPEIWPWIEPAYNEISKRGRTVSAETCVVGDGYAGRVDLIQEADVTWIWDWKTTRKLPQREAYQEHTIQAASYAAAVNRMVNSKQIRTGNVYISTVDQGKFIVHEHGDWEPVYEDCWKPLLRVWCYLNGYNPMANESF
jgi:hypothetical protein